MFAEGGKKQRRFIRRGWLLQEALKKFAHARRAERRTFERKPVLPRRHGGTEIRKYLEVLAAKRRKCGRKKIRANRNLNREAGTGRLKKILSPVFFFALFRAFLRLRFRLSLSVSPCLRGKSLPIAHRRPVSCSVLSVLIKLTGIGFE
jgi:hypothetical protein